ncbi:hypothetical protein [Nostoc piscinale]|uniref:hypothetical protein n=1 Tax=Nostoc piscinale TaxID=224012 RepID=UPI0007803E97|nr:hypothetical protein [Nostoc piscinale]
MKKRLFKPNFLESQAYMLSNEDEARIQFLTLREVFSVDREEWEVKREPKYDCYAHQGYVPVSDLLKDGWWFECYECFKKVDSEAWDYDEDKPMDVVVLEKILFCSHRCHNKYKARVQRIVETKEYLLKKFSVSTNLSVWPYRDSICASFDLPGCQESIRWQSDRPDEITYCAVDKDAIEPYLSRD